MLGPSLSCGHLLFHPEDRHGLEAVSEGRVTEFSHVRDRSSGRRRFAFALAWIPSLISSYLNSLLECLLSWPGQPWCQRVTRAQFVTGCAPEGRSYDDLCPHRTKGSKAVTGKIDPFNPRVWSFLQARLHFQEHSCALLVVSPHSTAVGRKWTVEPREWQHATTACELLSTGCLSLTVLLPRACTLHVSLCELSLHPEGQEGSGRRKGILSIT